MTSNQKLTIALLARKQAFKARKNLSYIIVNENRVPQKDIDWNIECVTTFFSALNDCFEIYGYRRKNFRPEEMIVSERVAKLTTEELIKCLKYELAWPLCRALNNPYPPRPAKYTPIFIGRYYDLIKCISRKVNEKKMSFLMTALNLKRACPKVPQGFQQKSMEAHKKNMTSEPVRINKHKRTLLQEFTDLFFGPNWDRTNPYERQHFIFSEAGCIENPRSKGGATNHFIQEIKQMDQLQDPVQQHTDFYLSEKYKEEKKKYLSRPPQCVIATTLDPLKARIITKNSYIENVAKPFQMMLHNRLKQFKMFKLIGSPVGENVVTDNLSHISKNKDIWVSADYESATDNLPPAVQQIIIAQALNNSGVPTIMRDQIIHMTKLHQIQYPDETINQTNGQLMGGLFSFPILCIWNAFLLCYAYHQEHGCSIKQAFKRMSGKTLINGDDLVYKGNKGLIKRWKNVVHQNGLKLSIGKTYYHKKYFTINSRMFEQTDQIITKRNYNVTVDKKSRTVTNRVLNLSRQKMIPTVLVHVALGGSRMQDISVGQISLEEALELYKLTVPKVKKPYLNREKIRKVWLNVFEKVLKDDPRAVCLPKELGGLDLDPELWGDISKLTFNEPQKLLAYATSQGIRWNENIPSRECPYIDEAIQNLKELCDPAHLLAPNIGPKTQSRTDLDWLIFRRGAINKAQYGNIKKTERTSTSGWQTFRSVQEQIKRKVEFAKVQAQQYCDNVMWDSLDDLSEEQMTILKASYAFTHKTTFSIIKGYIRKGGEIINNYLESQATKVPQLTRK